MRTHAKMDLCRGPIFQQTAVFTFPILLSGLLQLFFNGADMIVIGRFASAQSLAAVGCTAFFCNLVVTLFMGLSVGANVVVANAVGARDKRGTSHAIHTSMALAVLGGILMLVTGLLAARPVLELMNTPTTVMEKACLYFRIFCLGIPGMLVFNYGSAILRAAGDTKSPMDYLTISGVVNVLLNLALVVLFKMDVAGVAIATIGAHYLSAALIVRNLMRSRDACRFFPKMMRLEAGILKQLLRIGLPAGIQSSLFAISNMVITAGICTLGDTQLAGNTAAMNLEGAIYIATAAYYQSVTSFVGQNYGAGNYGRIVKGIFCCIFSSMTLSLILGAAVVLFAPQLMGLYTKDPAVIEAGVSRLYTVALTYALCSLMDVITGALRGIGHSVGPMVITLLGACLFRIEWVTFVFPFNRTLSFLMLCMPISWIAVSLVNGPYLYSKLKELKSRLEGGETAIS